MNIHSFFSRYCHFPVSCVAAIALVALSSSGRAFDGDIHKAARDGDVATVKALLEANPNLVNAKGSNDKTPLHYAAAAGHADVVALLLAYKADVHARDYSEVDWDDTDAEGRPAHVPDKTPLHIAAEEGQKDIVELLLANKANVNAVDDRIETPRLAADRTGHKDVAKLLRKHGGH